jgi:hypothetical protein
MNRSLAVISSHSAVKPRPIVILTVAEEGSPCNEVAVVFSMSSSDRNGQPDGPDGTNKMCCPRKQYLCVHLTQVLVKCLNLDQSNYHVQ